MGPPLSGFASNAPAYRRGLAVCSSRRSTWYALRDCTPDTSRCRVQLQGFVCDELSLTEGHGGGGGLGCSQSPRPSWALPV